MLCYKCCVGPIRALVPMGTIHSNNIDIYVCVGMQRGCERVRALDRSPTPVSIYARIYRPRIRPRLLNRNRSHSLAS